jgi:hypothetical protein
MKKTLYICGDSFCFRDPEYGDNWCDLLVKQFPDIDVVNLSSPGSSNYLIYLQVAHALEQKCDYLIYHATSSIRQEFRLKNDNADRDSITRYWRPDDQHNKAMISNSWLTPNRNTFGAVSAQSDKVLKEFFTDFVDLPVLVEKNYIFICHTLNLIAKNTHLTNWLWSRGGFEHKSFNTNNQWDFSQYANHECEINLWDEYDPLPWRPFYHITDQVRLQTACKTYANMLNLSND